MERLLLVGGAAALIFLIARRNVSQGLSAGGEVVGGSTIQVGDAPPIISYRAFVDTSNIPPGGVPWEALQDDIREGKPPFNEDLLVLSYPEGATAVSLASIPLLEGLSARGVRSVVQVLHKGTEPVYGRLVRSNFSESGAPRPVPPPPTVLRTWATPQEALEWARQGAGASVGGRVRTVRRPVSRNPNKRIKRTR